MFFLYNQYHAICTRSLFYARSYPQTEVPLVSFWPFRVVDTWRPGGVRNGGDRKISDEVLWEGDGTSLDASWSVAYSPQLEPCVHVCCADAEDACAARIFQPVLELQYWNIFELSYNWGQCRDISWKIHPWSRSFCRNLPTFSLSTLDMARSFDKQWTSLDLNCWIEKPAAVQKPTVKHVVQRMIDDSIDHWRSRLHLGFDLVVDSSKAFKVIWYCFLHDDYIGFLIFEMNFQVRHIPIPLCGCSLSSLHVQSDCVLMLYAKWHSNAYDSWNQFRYSWSSFEWADLASE